MKKTLIVLLTFAIAEICSAQEKRKSNSFKISGNVVGFPDSTIIYLSDLFDGSYKDIDSTFLVNEKFGFKGTLNEKIERFAIHTEGLKYRVSFWIDNTETFISGEKGKFKNAVVKGSKAQAKSVELDSIINVSKNKKSDYIKFIQNNPESIISANILSVYSSTWNKDTVSMLYKLLSTTAKNTMYGKNVYDFLSLNKNPKIGNKYFDFAQPNIDDRLIKLSDFKGKTILLEFWGSWCMPCRQGHPELIKTYYDFKSKGFEILGVAADTDKKLLKEAIQKDGLPWQNVSDLKGDRNKAALIYGISYYPANFLIDKKGMIVAKDLRGEKLREKLMELLP